MSKNWKPVYMVTGIDGEKPVAFTSDQDEAKCLAVALLARATAGLVATGMPEAWAWYKRGEVDAVAVAVGDQQGHEFAADVTKCPVLRRSSTHLTAKDPETGDEYVLKRVRKGWVLDVEHTALHNAKAA